LTLDAAKIALEASKPPNSSGTQCSPGLASTPDPVTRMTPNPYASNMPHHPKPTESLEVTPPSPQSQGLGASGDPPIGGDSIETPQENPHQWVPRVADTLTKNLDFIKAKFNIGRFITTRVNTKKEHAITEALKCNLEFASEQIKVSDPFPFDVIVVLSVLTPFLL
jgi:hypothetical protein